MGLFNKKELLRIEELEKENQALKDSIDRMGGNDFLRVQNEIQNAENTLSILQTTKKDLESQCQKIQNEINEKKTLLGILDSDIDMMDFALYTPKYNCMNSMEYNAKILANREVQKAMIKNKVALNYSDNWTLDGSKSKGAAMNNDNIKMYLRAFNNECEVLIDKVKYNNFDKIKDKIIKCSKDLDKLNNRNKISMTPKFLALKIEELHLVHEYNEIKQQEKEEIRRAREEERELAKLQKEIEEKRKSVKKEETHYKNAKEKLLLRLETADENEKQEILGKLDEVNEKIREIEANLKDIDYREANSKAGYVYVISNIGSFGEGVYKIGMTRRLDPQERIDELGSASVPFTFDVHAMIFSDDAPALEASLHQAFEDRKVNMVNGRKEFFRVSLEEIQEVVMKNHEKLIEFNPIADAEQYRETIKMQELRRTN